MVIAVDLDGTLAYYDGWKGPEHIGEPIPTMMMRVKTWIEQGNEVVIFTARVSGKDGEANNYATHHIAKWLRKHGLGNLEITCIKRMDFSIIYDDRAIQVETNTGVLL